MRRIILKLINIYQKTISPDHGAVLFGSAAMRCRFYPSCSRYTLEAVSRYGVLKGVLRGLWRILRCNPFSRGGVDPVRSRPAEGTAMTVSGRSASNGVDLA